MPRSAGCGESEADAVPNLSISEQAHKVATGDVLLFRPGRDLVGRIISAAGRGRWCHAAMAAWWGDDLFCLEVRELHGGRAILLEREVARRPGRIDVFRLTDACRLGHEINLHGAIAKMRRFAGADYGYWSVIRTALYHVPIVRMRLRPMTDDATENGRPPYCSQAVSYALRVGSGVDLVPQLADCATEPSDLARSAKLAYQFTMQP